MMTVYAHISYIEDVRRRLHESDLMAGDLTDAVSRSMLTGNAFYHEATSTCWLQLITKVRDEHFGSDYNWWTSRDPDDEWNLSCGLRWADTIEDIMKGHY